jgi:hypothetical protein
LEHVLAGHGELTIESPAHLPGKNSGRSREVDVAVRGRIGSHRVLVIVECRDRAGAQDVRWIEELVGKRSDVGANVAVAVSSSGFTTAARNMAAANWIQLRTVEQVSDADVLSWLRIATIKMRQGNFHIETIRFAPPPEAPVENVGAQVMASFESQSLRELNTDQPASVADIYRGLDLDEFYASLGASGPTSCPAQFRIEFPDRKIAAVTTDGGLIPLAGIELTGVASVEFYELPFTLPFQYLDEGGDVLAEGVEVEIDLYGVPVVVSLQRVESDDGTSTYKGVAFTHDGHPLPRFTMEAHFLADGSGIIVRGTAGDELPIQPPPVGEP